MACGAVRANQKTPSAVVSTSFRSERSYSYVRFLADDDHALRGKRVIVEFAKTSIAGDKNRQKSRGSTPAITMLAPLMETVSPIVLDRDEIHAAKTLRRLTASAQLARDRHFRAQHGQKRQVRRGDQGDNFRRVPIIATSLFFEEINRWRVRRRACCDCSNPAARKPGMPERQVRAATSAKYPLLFGPVLHKAASEDGARGRENPDSPPPREQKTRAVPRQNLGD